MKKYIAIMCAIAAFAMAQAQTIRIIPHSSPNPNSPSWAAYRDNAIIGIEQERAVGSGASAFVPIVDGEIGTAGMISLTTSGFPSWRGVANPAPPLNAEFGNRMHFGLHVTSATPFRLSDILYKLRSSDTISGTNSLKFEGSFETNTYTSTRVGIWYGPDGVKGTADDVRRTSGSGSALVNELVYIGAANAYVASNQGQIDQIRQYIDQNQPFTFAGEYTVLIGGNPIVTTRAVAFEGSVTLDFTATGPSGAPSQLTVGTVTVTAHGEAISNPILEVHGNYRVFLSMNGVPIQPVTGPNGTTVFPLPVLPKDVPMTFALSVDSASGTGLLVLGLDGHGAGSISESEIGFPAIQRSLSISFPISLAISKIPGAFSITLSAPAGNYDIQESRSLTGATWLSVSTINKGDEPRQILFIPADAGSTGFFRARRL